MIRLVYIASPSFSGSTLLTFMLKAHPDLATIGELKWAELDLDTYACSCGALLRECGFWRRVVAEMQDRGLPFNLERPPTDFRVRPHALADRIVRSRVRGAVYESLRDTLVAVMPPSRDAFPTIARVNREVMQAVMRLQGGSWFVDSSKDPVRLKYLFETGDYELRVIHLLRDGRGVTYSSIKNKAMSAESAARDWKHTHAQIERLARRIGSERVFALRYETLCTDVQRTMAALFTFIGVDPGRAADDYRRVEHHILGNRMRLRSGSEVKLDETWREKLGPEDLATFERVAGAANRRFGYA